MRRGWLPGFGIPLLALGVFFAGGLSQDHSLCSSDLGLFASPDECAATNLAFYGGIVAIILGLILIAAAVFGARGGHSDARSVRAGGYAAPHRVRLDRVSWLLIVAIAVLLLAAVGIGTYMLSRSSSPATTTPPTSAPPSANATSGQILTFQVESGAMEPAIPIGATISVTTLDGARPNRGDIVVFTPTPTEDCGGPTASDLVKRVIGLPGETISLSGGYVYIDGKRLDETWLPPSEQGITTAGPAGTPYNLSRPYRVPANDYFVIGDNRTDSCDSRYSGPVPLSYIVGVAHLNP